MKGKVDVWRLVDVWLCYLLAYECLFIGYYRNEGHWLLVIPIALAVGTIMLFKSIKKG